MTMTRARIAEHLWEQFGIDYDLGYQFVDVFFEELSHALVQDRQLKLASLGSFRVISKAKRQGRNPRTGEPYDISARNVVSFAASPKLKAMLNQETVSKQTGEVKEA